MDSFENNLKRLSEMQKENIEELMLRGKYNEAKKEILTNEFLNDEDKSELINKVKEHSKCIERLVEIKEETDEEIIVKELLDNSTPMQKAICNIVDYAEEYAKINEMISRGEYERAKKEILKNQYLTQNDKKILMALKTTNMVDEKIREKNKNHEIDYIYHLMNDKMFDQAEEIIRLSNLLNAEEKFQLSYEINNYRIDTIKLTNEDLEEIFERAALPDEKEIILEKIEDIRKQINELEKLILKK